MNNFTKELPQNATVIRTYAVLHASLMPYLTKKETVNDKKDKLEEEISVEVRNSL